MPIQKITVHNFKSYGGTHVIGPFKTFTAVIGPNGAGKSNIMDAISFVLGVKTAQLRGSALKDLIHVKHGKDKEDKSGAKRSAYIELNYEDESNGELSFRRSINPNGTSHYSVNGKNMKRSSYEDELKKIGVIVKARNFLVFQGDVSSIAQKSPKEITQLFETISGSIELVNDYESKRIARDQAEEEMQRTFKKKKSILKEEKQAREQKEETIAFQELIEEQQALKREYHLWQLYHVDKDLNHELAETEALKEEVDKQKSDLAELEKGLKKAAQEQAKFSRGYTDIGKSIKKKSRTIDKMQPAVIKIQEQISHIQKLQTTDENKYEQMASDIKAHNNNIKSLKKELKAVETAAEEFERLLQSQEGEELTLAANQLDMYEALKEKAQAETVALRDTLDQHERELKSLQDAISAIESKLSTLNERKSVQQDSLKQLANRKANLERGVTDTKKRLKEAKSHHEKANAQLEQARVRQEKVDKELQEVQEQLKEAKADTRDNERQAKMRECLDTLKRIYPGVRGSVQDLCKPTQERYTRALRVTMGKKNMEAVVVEDEKTAFECIHYLKDKKLGTNTFIPLDSIVTKPVDESLRHLGGSSKLVIDILEFDANSQRAIQFACSNTVVCDTLKEAQALFEKTVRMNKHIKIVTLDGTVIHKSGNMTGGSSSKHDDSGWHAKDVTILRQRREELLKEMRQLDRLPRGGADDIARTQILGLENRLKYTVSDLKTVSDKMKVHENHIKSIEAEMKDLEPEMEGLIAQRAEAEANVAAVKKDIAAIEDKHFAEFSESVGVASIREYEENKLAAAQQHLQRRRDLAEQRARLANQLEYEISRVDDSALASLEKRLSSHEDKLDKLRAQEYEKSKALDALKKELKRLEKQYSEQESELETFSKKTKKRKKAVAEARRALLTADEDITKRETHVEQLRNLRHEVLQTCQLQQIDLPVVGRKAKRSRAGVSKRKRKRKNPGAKKKGRARKQPKSKDSDDSDTKSSAESDSSGGESVSDQEVSDQEPEADVDFNTVELDYSSLKRNLTINSKHEYDAIKQQYMEKAASIEEDIAKLAPNLKAIEHFAEVKEKLTSTFSAFETLKNKNREANDAFEAIQQERNERFKEAFDHIASVIDDIYKELTRQPGFSGGSASLALESPSEPYLSGIKYTVTPPGKRYSDIQHLSGGEQSVAALALLFAIHSFKPAPFFILDEVDAALDPENVAKVSDYIRLRTRRDGLQCVVISLKDVFYTKADALVGVYKDQAKESSGNLTLDLEQHPEK